MTEQHWTVGDEDPPDQLHPDDPVIEAAIQESASLPHIAVAPAQAQFLPLLVLALHARRILEIGTLGGYSAIWMARALPTGGRLSRLGVSEEQATGARP